MPTTWFPNTPPTPPRTPTHLQLLVLRMLCCQQLLRVLPLRLRLHLARSVRGGAQPVRQRLPAVLRGQQRSVLLVLRRQVVGQPQRVWLDVTHVALGCCQLLEVQQMLRWQHDLRGGGQGAKVREGVRVGGEGPTAAEHHWTRTRKYSLTTGSTILPSPRCSAAPFGSAPLAVSPLSTTSQPPPTARAKT